MNDARGVILSSIGAGFELDLTPYQHLQADMGILEWKAQELERRLGISKATIYRWKRTGVPKYALAYMDLAIERYCGR